MIRLTFLPDDLTVEASPGERIIDIARRAGVGIKSDCGGKGKCGTCLVWFEAASAPSGTLSKPLPEEEKLLPENRAGSFFRLACRTRVYRDVLLTVPPESRVSGISPRKPFTKYTIPINPAVERFTFTLDHLEGEGTPKSHIDTICAALSEDKGKDFTYPSLPVMADFSRQPDAVQCSEITATIFKGREIIQLRPGANADLYGVALDLGTTSIAAFLCDLGRDRIVAVATALNPQVTYGEDVISRIAQVQKGVSNLDAMQVALIDEVNRLIGEIAKEAGITRDDILDVVAVGNPTMQHIFLGLSPVSLGRAPYLPVCFKGVEVEARHLNLYALSSARVHVLPTLSGFIGGDTLAALLTRDSGSFEGITLMVDVGTNGELVLVKDGGMTATSCATGPAFEGAQIKCGMRAAPGAIDKVAMDKETGTIGYQVIGGREERDPEKPAGFCGSGVISAISTLILAGIIKKDGAFDLECGHPGVRVNRQSGMGEMVIAPGAESKTGRDIVITQNDVRAVQLGKAALKAGIEILMKETGADRLDKILLAGTFGNYLDPREVLTIGMLPPIELGKIESIGNAAGDGARLALFSLKKRQEAIELAKHIHVVELSMRADFQEVFVDSMEF